jgi:hypothetical protein
MQIHSLIKMNYYIHKKIQIKSNFLVNKRKEYIKVVKKI